MNITELIKSLEYFKENGDGHLQVFFESKEGTEVFVLNAMKIEKSIIPKGIKYLLLGEYNAEKVNSPKPQATKEVYSSSRSNTNKLLVADKPLLSKEERKEFMTEQINKPIIKEKMGRGRPKGKRKTGIQRDFEGYNVKCRKCGLGKPSTDYKGTWCVCSDCRKRGKKK